MELASNNNKIFDWIWESLGGGGGLVGFSSKNCTCSLFLKGF